MNLIGIKRNGGYGMDNTDMEYTYSFPQVDDMYYYTPIRLQLHEAINLKELFGMGKDVATKVDSLVWRYSEDIGIYCDVYLRAYM